jgi:hypothetical protein
LLKAASIASDIKDQYEEYSALANPLNYFVVLAGFLVVPAALGCYYFLGGGKKRVNAWRDRKGKGKVYEKLGVGKV